MDLHITDSMNNINRMRFLNSKCKKVMNSYNKGHIQEDVIKALASIMGAYGLIDKSCRFCSAEDIGYCGLRRQPINVVNKMLKYCIPSYIEYSDGLLNKLTKRKEKSNE